jgi:hypothetical protein
MAGVLLALATDAGRANQREDNRRNIFVAHPQAAVGCPQASMRAQRTSVDRDIRASDCFGDRSFAVNGLHYDHAAPAVLSDIKDRAPSGRNDSRDPVATHRRIAVRQSLEPPWIGVLTGSKVIGASADGKWPR